MSVPDLELDAPGKKVILLGNEALARGFVEGGLQLAAAYPGTPSTEIMESLIHLGQRYKFYTEWSVNEKVAAEVSIAGSMAGLRTVCTMKGVGVNVASEPFQAFTYMDLRGGIALVTADDPGLHSSHTEQDNRYYALQMYMPVLEPYDAQEGHAMARQIFDLSETWCRPVMLRSSTRLGHTSANISLGKISKTRKNLGDFQRDPSRWVNLPMNARKMRKNMITRMDKVTKEMDDLEFNWLEGDPDALEGVITTGITYGYTKEALEILDLKDSVRILKLGLSYPLPYKLIEELLTDCERVLVVEEVEPIVERFVTSFAQQRGFTLPIHGKKYLPRDGEYSIDIMLAGLAKFLGSKDPVDRKRIENVTAQVQALVPPRLPILCPGCMHRGIFYAMKKVEKKLIKDKDQKKKLHQIVMPSDIGCYTLGYQPPLHAVDTHLCMGASIGVSNGFAHAIPDPIICTIGDSTFFHAGIPPLINAVFNTSNITIMILDNRTTAMTGYQPHPGTGVQACGETTKCVQIEEIVKACGVEFIEVVDPYNITNSIKIIESALKFPKPAVIIARRSCRMLELRDRLKRGEPLPNAEIDRELCTKCKVCLTQFGCPAIYLDNGEIEIDTSLCNGCGMCTDISVCKFKAISIK